MIEKGQLESPTAADYPDDQDDIPIPCKGCGEILEEGKAFELAGNRWHIDCFRCHTCGTYLDSDANLLLLGDGSLICNNCTYSCNSCGSKIEDLAILTGDQAFCANCFKCRNCKRTIENLRYARTSQGIFCMDCHESLMARRRKRTTKKTTQRQKPQSSAMHLDKSLPSLPSEHETPTSTDSYVELPADVPQRSAHGEHGEIPAQDGLNWSQAQQDNLILPASTYNGKRHSIISHKSDESAGEEFLIPVAFDPTPSEHPSSQITSPDAAKSIDERSRDYFGRNTSTGSSIESPYEQRPPLKSRTSASSPERQQTAYQERRPEGSESGYKQQNGVSDSAESSVSNVRSLTKHGRESTHSHTEPEKFQLSEAPKSKKSSGPSTPRTSNESPYEQRSSYQSTTKDSDSTDSKRKERKSTEHSRPANPISPAQMQYPPKRGDSLESKLHHTISRKDVDIRDNQSQMHVKQNSATGIGAKGNNKTTTTVDNKRAIDDSTPVPSPRPHTSGSTALKDQNTTPQLLDRRYNQERSEPLGARQSASNRAESSPSLPRCSAGGDFSLEEDMARILGDESQNHESFLRRVSNSVRHGRSFSEKGSRLSKELKWPKSPASGNTFTHDISSPSATSPEARDELNWFKNELRRERQKIIEKDQKIAELEAALNATQSIKEVNTELREKRSTMVFLDAQKEIVLRELEVLREHIATEKQSNAPLNIGRMSNAVLRDLAEALQRLKESFTPQIEELIQKRNDLVEELGSLGRLKDKSFQEFEQLSLKNAQLAELNNQIVHQIQELYKANSNASDGGRQAPNGLGIYHHKDKSTASVERDFRLAGNEPSPGVVQPEEAEPVTVIQGPQVVSIRKGQPKKFNWKKGGQNVAKGVTKGLKGAFLYGEGKSQREGGSQFTETSPYGNIASTNDNTPGPQRSQTQDPSRQGFGFFGNQKNKPSTWKAPSNGSTAVVNEVSVGLFGSDLEQRLEVEKGVIPSIVTRCIEEVELRGMDVEGIYRKSGGSSQVQMVRDGFERSRDFDISDPDLDIHSVTSALKQYFRLLPTPLITYAVYDLLLDANNVQPVSSRIDIMQHALQELPRVHRDVLEFLVFHLKRVVDRERENLMTSLNVAVVFAPTIMRPESLSREMSDVQKKNETLQFLVDNCQEIFMGMSE
ncbi:conserved hypothetical protein [Uncinocarpus reesii 1704]|uniref:Uncharacterized protein n=1 Tax=Uncinocarpus reesii (strain UAMH 1704) TaxID=336963 RepID=C4JLC0_UNCRE|nr:uncharacterized protein UREG_03628 [Uncinocarpus reesii 1704]EEP78782.1 conserved hypothetical protein [Uncinocarpus reesii 1704]